MATIRLFVNHDIELDNFTPLAYRLSSLPDTSVEMLLTEQWMTGDHRVVRLLDDDRITISTRFGRTRTRTFTNKLIQRLIHVRRKLNLDFKSTFRRVSIIEAFDPVEDMLSDANLLVIDNNNYWHNPRFEQITKQSDVPIWVHGHAPTKRDVSVSAQKQFAGDLRLHSEDHRVVVSGPNNGLLESLHPSVESQTLFVGDIRYDPRYLAYISDEFGFGDGARENVLMLLSPKMRGDAVIELIARLLKDGYNVVAKNHPRYHNHILRDAELPGDANFTLLNRKESITRLTEWADLIVAGNSTAVQEAIVRQKPVIIAEYLGPRREGRLSIMAPEKLRASTAEQFTDLYAIFRSDSSDERLTASDAFIGRNVYDPIDDRDLEEALNHSIYPRSAR